MSKVDHQKLVDFLSFRPRTFVVRMGWSNQGRKKERTLYGSSRRSGMTLVTSTSDEQEQHAIVLVALVVLVVLVVIVTSRTIFTISIARTTGTTLLALLALVVLVLVLLLVLIEFKLSTRPSDMQAKTVPLSCRRRLFDIVAFGNLPPSTLCSLTFNFLLRWVDASAAGMGCLRMDELSRLLGLAGADVDCLSYMCALRVCALCDGVSEKKSAARPRNQALAESCPCPTTQARATSRRALAPMCARCASHSQSALQNPCSSVPRHAQATRSEGKSPARACRQVLVIAFLVLSHGFDPELIWA